MSTVDHRRGERGQATTEWVALSIMIFMAILAGFNVLFGPVQTVLNSLATQYLGVVAGTP